MKKCPKCDEIYDNSWEVCLSCREKLYFDKKLTVEDARKQTEVKKRRREEKEKQDEERKLQKYAEATYGKILPLNLNVALTDGKISIENKEKFDLEKIDICLNHRIIDILPSIIGLPPSARFHLYVTKIKSDEKKEFDLSDFTDKGGDRLNKNKTKILNIWIIHHTTDGKTHYSYSKDLRYL